MKSLHDWDTGMDLGNLHTQQHSSGPQILMRQNQHAPQRIAARCRVCWLEHAARARQPPALQHRAPLSCMRAPLGRLSRLQGTARSGRQPHIKRIAQVCGTTTMVQEVPGMAHLFCAAMSSGQLL